MSVNIENMRKWIDALRSGEFKQGKSALTILESDGAMTNCCLGVACEIAYRENVVEKGVALISDGQVVYRGTGDQWRSGVLPYAVVEWLGVFDNDPVIDGGESYTQILATYANDKLGWTFAQIADALQKRYLGDGNE